MTSPRDPKDDLRRALRRSRPDAESQLAQSAAIRRHLGEWLARHPARTIAGFAALPGEPMLLPLLAEFPGRRWVLPRVDGETMRFHFADPATLVAGSYGIQEPPADSPVCPPGEIGLFLCPGMAFTPGGIRLGRGKGYYDRALEAANAKSTRVGVCFREQIRPAIPADKHDVPMDYLATPEGLLPCADETPTWNRIVVRIIGIPIGLLAVASALFFGFLIVVFFDNFNLARSAHLLVLLIGCGSPLLCLIASVLMIAHPKPRYLWLGLLAVLSVLGFFWALALPGARGIIH